MIESLHKYDNKRNGNLTTIKKFRYSGQTIGFFLISGLIRKRIERGSIITPASWISTLRRRGNTLSILFPDDYNVSETVPVRIRKLVSSQSVAVRKVKCKTEVENYNSREK